MANIAAQFETWVNGFTDADELMNFAATLGIQDLPVVRFRLFQLRNQEYGDEFVTEQMDMLLQSIDGPTGHNTDIREQEIEESMRALLFDDEMNEMAEACIRDGEWNPTSPYVQIGGGDEPQAGPSHRPDTPLQYNMRKKSERTYAKNAAVDRTYQVKVHEQHNGERLQDIRDGLHQMFEDVLHEARGDLAGNDLGRIVIQHDGLHDPIVVPLQPWDQLNADVVMETIEKVLNSNQNLAVDESFDIAVGTVDLPKGGARRRITKLKGKKNSIDLKKSIVTIRNDDQLCMARAIGVSWTKLKRCTPEEWKDITKTRGKKSNLQLILEHQKVPESHFMNLRKKHSTEQQHLAIAISKLAGVPLDRPASLNDVEAFENLLGVRVMVVSARLGNKFITSPSTDERPCIYIYLVDEDHFHAITSITGFFSARHFCRNCLKHYDHRERHQCDTSCIVCKRDNCPKTDNPRTCEDCNMECRSETCYQKHKQEPVHKKGQHKGKCSGPSQCKKNGGNAHSVIRW